MDKEEKSQLLQDARDDLSNLEEGSGKENYQKGICITLPIACIGTNSICL